MSQSKKNQKVDAKKLEALIKKTGKSIGKWSLENGWSESYVRNVMTQGVCTTPNLKYMALLLGVAEKDLQPDPEPVQEEIKIEQYPVGDSEMIGYMKELGDKLNQMQNKMYDILNAIQAIGGADEIVEKIMAKQKPRQVTESEQMLRKMFNSCGKKEAQYGAFYNNCKSKVDGVSLQHIHEAISNMGCEIVNANGGRVIRAIVKEIK